MAAGGKPVRLHSEAEAELQESVNFYRSMAGEQWAVRFKQRVEDAIASIAADSCRYRELQEFPGLRAVHVRQFPFSIIYEDEPSSIWVVAVAHASRRPGFWESRMQ